MTDPASRANARDGLQGAPGGPALVIALFALCALPTLLAARDPRAFNHDIAWLLHCSGLLLDGATPYVDFIENNPPLVIWLGVPAVALARWTGIPDKAAFDLLALGLVALSLAAAARVLRRGFPEPPEAWRRCILLVLLASLLLVPGYHFGQRDHLAVALFAPHLLAAAAALAGRPLRGGLAWSVGLLSAPGFALKPHFLLAWLAVEASVLAGRREARALVRAENLAVAGFLPLYALAVVWLTPGFLEVARWSLAVYGAYAEPVSPFARELHLPLAGALVFAALRSTPATASLRRVAFAALLALVAAVFLQNRGFSYHWVPAATLAWVSIGLAALAVAERPALFEGLLRLPARAFPAVLALGIALAALGRGGLAARQAFFDRERYLVTELARIVRRHAPQGPIVVYSTRIYPGFPLVNLTGAAWASRFANQWLVPGAYSALEKRMVPFPYHEREAMGPLERFQIDAAVADLRARPPGLIVFDRHRTRQGMGATEFDFREFFLRDPRFAEIFAGYRRLGELERFELYERVRGGDGAPAGRP